MRNPQVSYDPDVDITDTCNCCGGEFYHDAVLKVSISEQTSPLIADVMLCENCVEELPELLKTDVQYNDPVSPANSTALLDHCKRSRVLNFIPASEQINTEEDVREFFAALTQYLVWHPETEFGEYVNASVDTDPSVLNESKRLFSEEESGQLNECMRKAFEVCEKITKHEVDPYEIAFEEQAKANEGMAAATGRDHKTGKMIEDQAGPKVSKGFIAKELCKAKTKQIRFCTFDNLLLPLRGGRRR